MPRDAPGVRPVPDIPAYRPRLRAFGSRERGLPLFPEFFCAIPRPGRSSVSAERESAAPPSPPCRPGERRPRCRRNQRRLHRLATRCAASGSHSAAWSGMAGRQGLLMEYVQTGTADLSRGQRCEQSSFIDNRAACSVDQDGLRLHESEAAGVDQSPRFRG
jgi:hypothetical protein